MNQNLPKVILLLGKPGSGKSTQGRMIAERFGHQFFSIGDEYRAMADAGGENAQVIGDEMAEGKLLPLWLTVYIFQRKLLENEGNFVVDGVARRLKEAQVLDEMIDFFDWDSLVFNLNVPDSTSVDRIVKRKERPEDNAHIAHKRIDKYHEFTDLAVQYYRSKRRLIEIDGSKMPEEVFSEIARYIEAGSH